MKALRQQAKAICKTYQEEALEAHDQFEEETLVPAQLRERTIAYVKQWPTALPLRGIIIGQYPQDIDELPPLAASFSFEGEEPNLLAKIMAQQMSLCCPGAKQSSTLTAIQQCWKLAEHGVLSVHALPLGPCEATKGPSRRKPWEDHQIGCLSSTLAQLIGLSSQTNAHGTVTIVAVGKWAEVVAKQVEGFVATDELWSDGWILERHDLYHPGYVWHKYHNESVPTVVMGEETGLRALHFLFTVTKRKASPSQVLSSKQTKGQAVLDQGRKPPALVENAVSCQGTSSTTEPKPKPHNPAIQRECVSEGEEVSSQEQKPKAKDKRLEKPRKPAERTIQDVLQYLTSWHLKSK